MTIRTSYNPIKIWWVILLFFVIITPSGNVVAQQVPIIETLQVDLWPEYDRPKMLVIYRVELSTDISPPVALSFRIPLEVGEPHAVAVRDSNGALLTAPYERTVEEDWAVITLIATMPGIQLEYYDPGIQIEGSQRNFQFTWPGDYAVESMSVQLQQPSDASQVKTSPAAISVLPGSDGLNYHTINLGARQQGATSEVSIAYTKTGDALSIEDLPIQPLSPITTSIASRMNITNYLPWGLGTLGVFLLSGGIYWYWRLGNQPSAPKSRQRGARSTSASRGTSSAPDEMHYCHQCGKRAPVGDRFCRACGTRLRHR